MSRQSSSIYIISGPCGVGKSTISRNLSDRMSKSVLIEGDQLNSMIVGENQPAWEERLAIVWENIVSLTKNVLQHERNVVIDYVVEDELDWFAQQFADIKVHIHYVVLRADKNVLNDRLTQRENIDLIERSLFLLKKLEGTRVNEPFLLDTTDKRPFEVVEEIERNKLHYRCHFDGRS
ncbi:AAA family ATPase [Halobacillus sp. B23F22_1]|uniref:AAA family ATPase n=1 Tax=Halobacillus sp. B23F22_1 TaxID=3459514 RepID=UPI00373F9B68